MGLFKKKQRPTTTEIKCPVEGCYFTCSDHNTLKKHMDWRHQELAKTVSK